MSDQQVKKVCEKCSFFLGSFQNNPKRLQCTHLQKRRSKRILERRSKSVIVQSRNLSNINSEVRIDENPPWNVSTDENLNFCITNSEISIEDDVHLSATISHLPHEMLYQIFSHVPFMDLYYNASQVCQRWKTIARDGRVWETMLVDGRMSSHLLHTLLSKATNLQRLEIINRKDSNAILRKVVKFCPRIKYISLSNCRGSKTIRPVSFTALVKAVIKYRNLKIRVYDGTRLSPAPLPTSNIMKNYGIKYFFDEENVITIFPIRHV